MTSLAPREGQALSHFPVIEQHYPFLLFTVLVLVIVFIIVARFDIPKIHSSDQEIEH